jgi:hypothetical protein
MKTLIGINSGSIYPDIHCLSNSNNGVVWNEDDILNRLIFS